VTATDGTWTITTIELSIGTYTASAVATDTFGNVSTLAEATFDVLPLPTVPRTPLSDDIDSDTVLSPPVVTQGATPLTTTQTDDNQDDQGEILGASDDENKAPLEDTGSVLGAETEAGKYFGLMWYWWLIIAAALAALWWLIGNMRKNQGSDA
jgi:hypothetical protein